MAQSAEGKFTLGTGNRFHDGASVVCRNVAWRRFGDEAADDWSARRKKKRSAEPDAHAAAKTLAAERGGG